MPYLLVPMTAHASPLKLAPADIVASYPLSPVQAGMMFHVVSAPGSGVDVEQMIATLPEAVDVGALTRAWQELVGRHPALRTASAARGTLRCEAWFAFTFFLLAAVFC